MTDTDFESKVKELIDDLKAICATYGLGNDGNEFKIITQVFLYKFLNDKFAHELKKHHPELQQAAHWEAIVADYSEGEYKMKLLPLGGNVAKLYPRHLLATLASQQNEATFSETLDETLLDIATINHNIFAIATAGGAKVPLFTKISEYITDPAKRTPFCRAIVDKLTAFNFEHIFSEKYDFFATIFEYLIADYNKDSGGKYAEYYTPHAVSRIMAAIMVEEGVSNVSCYDPSAGSGTLLMSLAHAIGEDKCAVYTQDISQKSSNLLRLNLILNGLVSSIQNVVQGNTILAPYHRQTGGGLQQFDYIVSNPPFKLDFSDYRDTLDSPTNRDRFFAGIPKIPKKAKDKMAIYSLFLQHIMHSLTDKGRAAIVVPTGFITAQSGIDKKIRQQMVASNMIAGVVSMPSNIFATTGTNVSIVFLDKANTTGKVVLIDASNLGTKVKEGKNQKTVLSPTEEQHIIDTFRNKQVVEDLSVVVSLDEIKEKNYSLSAGQYFEVKIEYVDITAAEFEQKMQQFSSNLDQLFQESNDLEQQIKIQLGGLKYGS